METYEGESWAPLAARDRHGHRKPTLMEIQEYRELNAEEETHFHVVGPLENPVIVWRLSVTDLNDQQQIAQHTAQFWNCTETQVASATLYNVRSNIWVLQTKPSMWPLVQVRATRDGKNLYGSGPEARAVAHAFLCKITPYL